MSCPYNPAHVIPENGLITHVKDCCAANPSLKFGICIYNRTHLFRNTDIDEHYASCQSKPEDLTISNYLLQILHDRKRRAENKKNSESAGLYEADSTTAPLSDDEDDDDTDSQCAFYDSTNFPEDELFGEPAIDSTKKSAKRSAETQLALWRHLGFQEIPKLEDLMWSDNRLRYRPGASGTN